MEQDILFIKKEMFLLNSRIIIDFYFYYFILIYLISNKDYLFQYNLFITIKTFITIIKPIRSFLLIFKYYLPK